MYHLTLFPNWNIYWHCVRKRDKLRFLFRKIMHKVSNRKCNLIKNVILSRLLCCVSALFSISESNIYYVNQNRCMEPISRKMSAERADVYDVVRFPFTCTIIWYTQRPRNVNGKTHEKRVGTSLKSQTKEPKKKQIENILRMKIYT